MPASLTGITTPLSWQDYPKLLDMGPLWFVAMLLIFDIGHAIWWAWAARRNRVPLQETTNNPPSYRTTAAFILILAVTTYLIRIVIPLGRYVAGFPTLSYLPQYVSFFIIGTVAVALMELSLEHLLKFGLAAVITVPLCFAAAYLVLRIPFASRVL
jgi:phosphatidylglycerophosphate synthase